MELQDVVSRMNEKARILNEERQRMARFVDELESIYLRNNQEESSKVCRLISQHLRTL